MKYGLKTEIADKIGKTASFVCQYFNRKKHMSWKTALIANKAYPFVKTELWMNRDITKINKAFSKHFSSIRP